VPFSFHNEEKEGFTYAILGKGKKEEKRDSAQNVPRSFLHGSSLMRGKKKREKIGKLITSTSQTAREGRKKRENLSHFL